MSRFNLSTADSYRNSSAASETSSSHSPKTLASLNTARDTQTTKRLATLTLASPSDSSDSNDVSEDDDNDDLPYPLALPRSDFLSPNFSATEYLSSLSSRHQTLEDLRSDLRERSQFLSKELLDLVNINYEQFLNLGQELKGGEERIEDVRVGLLGFSRGVTEVRSGVKGRRENVESLIKTSEVVRAQVEVGRNLLELVERVEGLEGRLMVGSLGREGDGMDSDWSDSSDSDSDSETGSSTPAGTQVKKLQNLVREWKRIEGLCTITGREHPFIRTMDPRMTKVRNTLLLDLGVALKAAVRDGKEEGASERLLAVMGCYGQLDESKEAVRVLKSLKG